MKKKLAFYPWSTRKPNGQPVTVFGEGTFFVSKSGRGPNRIRPNSCRIPRNRWPRRRPCRSS